MNWTGGRLNHHKNTRNRPRFRTQKHPFGNEPVGHQSQTQVHDKNASIHESGFGVDDALLEQRGSFAQGKHKYNHFKT